MKKILKFVFPRGSVGFRILLRIAIFIGLRPALPINEIHFNDWTDRVEPLLWTPLKKQEYQPLVSIVVPVFNPPAEHFLPMIYSVVNQTYDNWQLILANASTQKKLREMVKKATLVDERIQVVNLETNFGIAKNTNAAIEQAKGEYIGFLDHDDQLAPQALYEVVSLLQSEEKPEFIYSDEDKITNDSQYRFDPHFKPDWSPQLFRELNYINHFVVVEKNLLNKCGKLRQGFEGAQDYDLFLRLIDQTKLIAHIPKILYHWRISKTSTALNFSQKEEIIPSGIHALKEHLARNKQSGEVKAIKNRPGFYKITYSKNKLQKISILILPTQFESEYRNYIYKFLKSAKKTDQQIDLFIYPLKVPLKNIPNNVTLYSIDESDRRLFIEQCLNSIESDLCLIIGCAMYPIGKQWLTSMAGLMTEVPSVAIVSPLLLRGDKKTIVESGLIIYQGSYIKLFAGYKANKHTTFGDSDWVRNVDAVSGRCLMIRTNILKRSQAELLSEGPLLFKSRFFSLLKFEDNNQVVVWPFVKAIYAGDMQLPKNERSYFNPNLEVTRTEFTTLEIIKVPKDYED